MVDRVIELCDNFTKVDLMRECEKRGISTAGEKKAMAKRIISHDTKVTMKDVSLCANDETPDNSQREKQFEAVKNDVADNSSTDDDGSGERCNDDED